MPFPTIIGAIAGDIIGSRYEWDRIKTTDFELLHPKCDYTDDSVMTLAVAKGILEGKPFGPLMHAFGRAYPGRGYGGNFYYWLLSDNPQPYNSFGNGSAMRVSPAGFAFQTLAETLAAAEQTALPSHNHPEGIKGAQATAGAMFLARKGSSKKEIAEYVTNTFDYDLSRSMDEIRPDYYFDETCQLTVPPAIQAFLESDDYESAIRLAVSLGGDSDTLACITGGIAAAYYRYIPQEILDFAYALLPKELADISRAFDQRFGG
ncbi:MAG: ADP-ribosylglycohydrolase family protein [Bacteroidia bacterium]|nr:ADP-ribosylglycohydrolase family protein [Bacteroidia bacterium]